MGLVTVRTAGLISLRLASSGMVEVAARTSDKSAYEYIFIFDKVI
jgi:hypothetical protein